MAVVIDVHIRFIVDLPVLFGVQFKSSQVPTPHTNTK